MTDRGRSQVSNSMCMLVFFYSFRLVRRRRSSQLVRKVQCSISLPPNGDYYHCYHNFFLRPISFDHHTFGPFSGPWSEMENKEKLFEVVISGVGGKFPMSENIEELKNNLNNKVNMVTDDDSRWNKGMLKQQFQIGFKSNFIRSYNTCL